jgi:hypothetical protein
VKLSPKLITSPLKKNLELLSGHRLLIQRRMRSKPIQMKWEVEVEVEKNFKQQLCKATWKKNLINPIWTK